MPVKPRVKSQNTRREREKSCHHGSGRATGGRELDSYIPIHRGLESGPLCGLWFSLGLSDTGGLHTGRVGSSIPCDEGGASDLPFFFLPCEGERGRTILRFHLATHVAWHWFSLSFSFSFLLFKIKFSSRIR